MERLTMSIDGMSCAHCVGAVERALGAVPGVAAESVTIGAATVSYDPSVATPEGILAAVTGAGYAATAGDGAATPHTRGCC